MNMHVSAPGGWEPPEPPWMKELRMIDRTIASNVDRYIRWLRRMLVAVIVGALAGQLVGLAIVKLVLEPLAS